MVLDAGTLGDDELTYLYLPLAHSFALLIQFGTFALGATLAYWERDPLKIIPNLAEVKPTYFPSVPRIFEKIYTAATAAVEKEGGLKKAVFDWAIGVGAKVRETRARGQGARASCCSRQYEIADKQVLREDPRPVRRADQARGHRRGARSTRRSCASSTPPACSIARGLGHDRDLDRGDDRDPRGLQVRHRRPARSPAARSRSPRTARSSSRGPTSSRATTRTPRRRRRRSSTAGFTPATSASSTPTATSRSPAARRTSSSPRAARTSRPPTSRPRSSSTRSSPSAS